MTFPDLLFADEREREREIKFTGSFVNLGELNYWHDNVMDGGKIKYEGIGELCRSTGVGRLLLVESNGSPPVSERVAWMLPCSPTADLIARWLFSGEKRTD